jgi:hypothetical protein
MTCESFETVKFHKTSLALIEQNIDGGAPNETEGGE